MSDILCVTNRALCREDFLRRMEKIAAARPAAVILREKDLPEADYTALAREVLAICRWNDVPCILHSFPGAARTLEVRSLHLPLPLRRALPAAERDCFITLGASCHSAEEAREAAALGCTYLTAGHVFDTACKAGTPGRGLEFLRQVCAAVSVPVYAIGGIGPDTIAAVRDAGAAGACVMSGLMECDDPGQYLAAFAR